MRILEVERKIEILKGIPQEKEKPTRNKTILQEPYKRNRYLSSPPSKIFGTIFEVDQRT